MNAFEYFVQVNGYLILFYSFFYLLLKNETFFNLNRVYLLGGVVLSFLIPILHSEWINDLFGSQPVNDTKVFINALLVPVVVMEDVGTTWTMTDWIVVVYFVVAFMLLLRMAFRLLYIIIKPVYEKSLAYSFFNRIFVSESLAAYPAILKHEETHARQYHSLDVILLELVSIIVWYNPVLYLYKRSVKHIHEFIADEAACLQEKKEDYAMLLLSNTLGVPVSQLVNNFFNHSLLKKRIMMLHKKKSNRSALLKYGLSAPLFICMLVFSSARIDAESKVIIEKADVTEPVNTLQKIKDTQSVFSDAGSTPDIPASEIGTPIGMSDTTGVEQVMKDYTKIDQLPEFFGGMPAFYQYVGKNFKYPAEARRDSVSGKLMMSFVVEKDGALTDIKVLRDLGHGTGAAAVEVLEKSPKWKPGTMAGRPVRVQYTLPISLNVKRSGQASNISRMQDSSSATGVKLVSYRQNTGTKPLYIVDGRQVSQAEMEKLPPSDIEAINVYKHASATAVYGDKGKNGVVKITTKKAANVAGFKGLVVIDGKTQSKGFNLNSIDPNKIESMNVLKGSDAATQYGIEGKEGVIIIKTKQ